MPVGWYAWRWADYRRLTAITKEHRRCCINWRRRNSLLPTIVDELISLATLGGETTKSAYPVRPWIRPAGPSVSAQSA
jgi:hypothetical protein